MKIKLLIAILGITLFSCETKIEKEYITEPCPKEMKTSMAQQKKELTEKGFKTFDYVDEKTGDTILMQQYFIAFLKTGPNRSQTKSETDSLQKLHLAHLGRMYEEGFADISGPFGDDGEIRGITIYNVPTQQNCGQFGNYGSDGKIGTIND